jgi:excisionase family DNA binding protein
VRVGDFMCDPGGGRTLLEAHGTCIWLGERPRHNGGERRGDPAALLSFKEALELLRVSRNTLYRLCRAGKIPGARRVGRAWRFHRESLLKWLSCTGPDTHGKRRKR